MAPWSPRVLVGLMLMLLRAEVVASLRGGSLACSRGGPSAATKMLAGPPELWQGYLGLLQTAPLPTKAVTASVIIGAGDAAAQAVEAAKRQGDADASTVDVARVARWALFGLVLQGPWNHFFYLALDGALPPTAEPFTPTTAGKVFIDQFVQAPVFTATIFVFFAVLEGRGFAAAKNQIDETLGPVLLKNWAVFLPATVINLGFLPNELRVLFLNSVFFFWVIFLSLTVNAQAQAELDEQ